MKKLLIILFLINSSAFAAFEQKGIGADHMALSLAGLASRSIDFSTQLNPAILHFSKDTKISLFYRNYYGIKDLNQIALNGTFYLAEFPAGISLNRYGNKIYSETQLTLGTAYALDEQVIIGLNTSIYHLEIKNYNSAQTFSLSLAVLYMLTDQLNISAIISNINEPKIGGRNETLPLSGTLAFSFMITDNVEFMIDVFKEDQYEFEYRFASRINVVKHLNLLAGLRENINSFSAGLEYENDNYAISYGIDFHPVLNMSHALGMSYAF